ncbi:hypothetical protein BVC80_1023g5 [Macleaya cordata]|uniref:Uncharacterized protein n=1 Tax=Macleaya cordata TaxID=56857 RepID=A0A200QQT4_MACCD|nr:hypothetical protein BVC80_1023g5 [Macleaya cordata]
MLERCEIPYSLSLCLQSIVKGLRESGVFRSVIESAQKLSKDKFLSSIESRNSSRATSSETLSTRKIGNREESKATVRKVLEVEHTGYHAAAIPPLSPPGMDNVHLEE